MGPEDGGLRRFRFGVRRKLRFSLSGGGASLRPKALAESAAALQQLDRALVDNSTGKGRVGRPRLRRGEARLRTIA